MVLFLKLDDMEKPPKPTKQAVIDDAVKQFKDFLENNFNGKRIRAGAYISVATLKTEITFVQQSPAGEARPLTSNKHPQVTKRGHLEILCGEMFESIRDPNIRTMGREVIQLISMSDIQTITAAEIIALFKKNRLTLYGRYKRCFQTELGKINQVLKTKYGCRIMRYNEAEFNNSPDRHFALFMTTTKALVETEE